MTTTTLELILVGLTAAVMVIGVVGLIVPVFPGLTIMWLAALGWAIYSGFSWPGWLYFVLITILMVVGNWVDNVFIGAKARLTGASWWSIIAGYALGILFAIFFTPIGGIGGTILGVFGVEYLRHRDVKKAIQISREMLFGFGWSIVVRIGIGILMLILWVFWAYQLF